MAEQSSTKSDQKTTDAPEATSSSPQAKQDGTETNTGTASAEAFSSSDLAVADAAGISEGEVKALRDDAGLNRLAGHEADVHAWSLTEAGKEFKDSESDRKKAAKAEADAFDKQTNKDGLTEAEAKYAEAVKG